MMSRSCSARPASVLVLVASVGLASANGPYVWRVKGGGKIVQANVVAPPVFQLGMTPRDQEKPSSDLVPGPGTFSPFQMAFDPFQTNEFTTWFLECSKGKNIRKSISVQLLKAGRQVYAFEAAEAELSGFALPGFQPGRLVNFATLLEAQSARVAVQDNPLYEEGRPVVNPLFGVRVQMGDGSVRPTASGPISFGLTKGADEKPVITVKPIRFEMMRGAAEPYRKWLQDLQKAIDSGQDASRLARPLTIQYLTQKGTFTVKLGRTFVQSVVLLGDGSVRVTVQTDVTGEITLQEGRE